MPSTFLGFGGTGSEQSRQKALLSWSLHPSGDMDTKIRYICKVYDMWDKVSGYKVKT